MASWEYCSQFDNRDFSNWAQLGFWLFSLDKFYLKQQNCDSNSDYV